MLYNLANGFGSENAFIFLDHEDKSFHLFLVLFSDLFVGFEFEMKAFGLVDPVDPFSPGLRVVKFGEDLFKFLFCLNDVILMCIDDQIVIFGKQGNQSLFFELVVPGQLFKKVEEFALVYCISLGEAANVYNGIEGKFMFFQLVEYFFPHISSVWYFVKSRDIQYSKANVFSLYLKGCAIIKIDIGCYFLEGVSHFDFWVACEQFGGGTFAWAWSSYNQDIEGSHSSHNFK